LAEIDTCGRAISGYCATGKVRMASAPASMITMAMTHAKMGLSMKKRESIGGWP